MHRHFYALPGDLTVICDLVEASQPLRYTRMGSFDTARPMSVCSGAELPTLHSPAPGDNAIAGHSYLVTLRDVEPLGRRIDRLDGGVSYGFDQLSCPDSIELLPGARHPSGPLLYGRIATVSDTAASVAIFNLFKRAIGKRFRRVNAFWVGPLAAAAWRDGARLTIGVASPPEYDLREPSEDGV